MLDPRIVVVRRGHFATFELLTRTFADDSSVQIMWDRRMSERRLAACVHTLPPGLSRYRWQGQIECKVEITLIIKCTTNCYPEVEAEILRQHPHEVPEIVALPVRFGLPAFIDWVRIETG